MKRFRSERNAGYDLVRGALRRLLVEAKIDVERVEPVPTPIRVEPTPVETAVGNMPQVRLIPERPPQQPRQPEPRQQQKQQQHSLRTDLDRSSKAALSQGGAAELHSLGSSSHDPRHLDEASALAELDRFRLADPVISPYCWAISYCEGVLHPPAVKTSAGFGGDATKRCFHSGRTQHFEWNCVTDGSPGGRCVF